MMALLFVVGAYLLGSIPFAILASKALRLPDPRSYGSNNPGATNVLRSGNKTAAILTLAGDVAKGAVAVLLAKHFMLDQKGVVFLVAIAVFLGHVFTVFLRFKGGKGVATALGVLLALNVWVGVGALATWVFMALVFRYSSLSALVAAIGAPAYAFMLGLPREWVLASGIMSLLLIWRHKGNIKNLLAGKESKIGKKSA